jgi:hypothetical protein
LHALLTDEAGDGAEPSEEGAEAAGNNNRPEECIRAIDTFEASLHELIKLHSLCGVTLGGRQE